MKKTILFISIILFLFTSCIRSRVMKQPGMDFEPTNPSQIEIFYFEPELDYIKIGVVKTSGAPLSSWENNEECMKLEASKIGGHAVILTKEDRPVSAVSQHENVRLVHRRKELTGIVIRWKK